MTEQGLHIGRVIAGGAFILWALVLYWDSYRKLTNQALHLISAEYKTFAPLACIFAFVGGLILAPRQMYVSFNLFLFFAIMIWPVFKWLHKYAIGKRLITDGLSEAVFRENTEKVKQSLEADGDPNKQGSLGWTALHINALAYNEEIARLLLRAGASPDIPNEDGHTANDMFRFFFDHSPTKPDYYKLLEDILAVRGSPDPAPAGASGEGNSYETVAP